MNQDTLILYILSRNDLPSMGQAGKAGAQWCHASNQFIWENAWGLGQIMSPKVDAWMKETSFGFGTTVTLSVDFDQLKAAVLVAKAIGCHAGETFDPEYPYIVTEEIANLIYHPVEHPPIRKSSKEVLCFRKELTAAYVFGYKSELRPILGNFPLVPQ